MALKYNNKAISAVEYNGKLVSKIVYNNQHQIDLNLNSRFEQDKSKLNQSELSYSCEAGQATVNLFTGRLLFVHNDMSIGANSFQIEISHIYNSRWADSDSSNRFSFVGRGWKLNIQQYCYLYQFNDAEAQLGFVEDDFVYIDGAGYKHRFVNYKNTTENNVRIEHFYDAGGTGLRMKLYPTGETEIINQINEIMQFASSGELIKIVSGLNQNIQKEIKYKDGKIIAVFDVRKPNRKFKFSYNQSGLLEKIACIEDCVIKKTIEYDYDTNDSLVRTSTKVGVNIKNKAIFSYHNMLLTHAVDAESKSALKIEYDSSDLLVKRVNIGVADLTGYIVNMSSILRSFNTINYVSLSLTTVTNEKDIKMAYFFNARGFTTSVLEFFENDTYKTLFKTKGWKLSDGGDGNAVINNEASHQLVNNSYDIPYDNIKTFKAALDSSLNGTPSRYKYNEKYVASFWLRFRKTSALDAKVKLMIDTRNMSGFERNLQYEAFADKTAKDAWQYVTIPIDFESKQGDIVNRIYNDTYIYGQVPYLKLNIRSMKLKFEGLPQDAEIEIADLRIAVGTQTNTIINNQNFAFAKRISYLKSTTTIKEIDSDFFLTESDVFSTYKNMFVQRKNNPSESFDFVACGGTQVISVKQIGFIVGNNSVVHHLKIEDNKPNMYVQAKNKSGEKEWFVNKTDIEFFDDYFVQKNAIGIIKNYNDTMDETKASTNCIATYFNGNNFYKKDAYKLITKITYDLYGNIINNLTYNEADEDKVMAKIFTYDSATEEQRENILEVSDNVVRHEQTFNSPLMQPNTATIAGGEPAYFQKTLVYDEFGEKVKSVQAISGQQIIAFNNLEYENGLLKELSDQANRRYIFTHNVLGDITSYTAHYGNGEEIELLNKNYVYGDSSNNYESIVAERYKTTTGNAERHTTIDKYGKPKLVSENDLATSYDYQNLDESSSLSKLNIVYDPYENQNYEYFYNDDNMPCGYKTLGSTATNAKHIVVRQIDDSQTQYELHTGGIESKYTRTSSVIRESSESKDGKKVYLEPRIYKTTDFDDGFDNDQKEDFQFIYEYDSLGRLHRKTNGKKIKYTQEFEYRRGFNVDTNIIKEISTKFNHNYYEPDNEEYGIHYDWQYEFTCICEEYDARGNVLTIKEDNFYERTIEDSWNAETPLTVIDNEYVVEYTYDEMNRLKTEKNTVIDIDVSYEYELGQLKSIIDNDGSGARVDFVYNGRGQLSAYGIDGEVEERYHYDNYGNIINILDRFDVVKSTLTWTRGNLLASYDGIQYKYNHQGVRWRKIEGNVAKHFYLDGSRILGEDWINPNIINIFPNKIIRYFYDANGLAGMRVDGVNYRFILDLQKSVRKIFKGNQLICEYDYDSFGKCYIKAYDENLEIISNPPTNHTCHINPFRWKSHYYDEESKLYYLNGRYYDPKIGQFINADNPETIIEGATVINGLNPHSVTTDNHLNVSINVSSIFTDNELFVDTKYDKNAGKSWWQLHWRQILPSILYLVTTLVSLVLMCIPGTSAFGVGMFVAGMKGAASGLVVGGVIGGLTSALNGSDFWEGIERGAINGFMNGFTTAAILYCVSAGISAISDASNKARRCESSQCFIAGTIVLTSIGDKKIEDIKIGDEVWSYDEETGKKELKKVTQLFRNGKPWTPATEIAEGGTYAWAHIKVASSNEEIVCTPGHKFFVPDNKKSRSKGEKLEHVSYEGLSNQWVSAEHLITGDRILLANDEYDIIQEVYIDKLDEPKVTYNLEVEISLSLLSGGKLEKITAKSEDTFNVEGKGVIEPKDVKVGDKIILENGEIATVLSAEEKTTGGPQTTYNLEVEDYHTYFVGESGVLVHNCCSGDEVAEIIGKAHGSPEHQAEINRIAGEMAQSGDYSKIYLNRSLSTTGVKSGSYLRPDIIGVNKGGGFSIVEVASKTQVMGTTAYNSLQANITFYNSLSNVSSVRFIPWGY